MKSVYYHSLSGSGTGEIIFTNNVDKAYKFDFKIYAEVLRQGLMEVFEIPLDLEIIEE